MATYRLQKIFRQEGSDAALEALRADKILRLQEARAEEKRRKEENRAKLLKGAAIGAATLGGLYAANKGWLGKGMCSLTRSGINLVTGKTDQAKKEWGRVGKGFQRDWREIFGYPTKPAVQQTQNQGQAPVANASQQNQGGQTSVVSTPANGGGTPAPVNGTGGQNPPVTDTSVNPTPPAGGGGTQNPPVTPAPATDTSVVTTPPANGGTTQVATQGNGNKGGNRGRRNNNNQQGNNRGRRNGGQGNNRGRGSGATYRFKSTITATADKSVPGGFIYSGKTKK